MLHELVFQIFFQFPCIFFHKIKQNNKTSSKSLSVSKASLLSPTKSLTNTPALSHKKSTKIQKEKRKSNTKFDGITNPSSAQWYTTTDELSRNGIPIVELRQELTSSRPLRSEVEKERRLSRPQSGQYSRPSSLTIRTANSSGNSSNRDSIGTTDSSVSEEDAVPPPLPVKCREADYCNLPSSNGENTSFLHSNRNSTRNSFPFVSKIPVPDPDFEVSSDVPPTPPPKPPKKKILSLIQQ